jgi:hypothetical protein
VKSHGTGIYLVVGYLGIQMAQFRDVFVTDSVRYASAGRYGPSITWKQNELLLDRIQNPGKEANGLKLGCGTKSPAWRSAAVGTRAHLEEALSLPPGR